MTPTGHLAFAYLATRHRAPRRDRARIAAVAMAGAMLPDVVDKTLLVVGAYPWGRTVGHSLVTWVLLVGIGVLVTTTLRGWMYGRWLALGAATHLLADFADDLFAGFAYTSYALTSWFLWPLRNPDQWEWRVAPLAPGVDVAPTMFEYAVIFAAAFWMTWDGRRAGDAGRNWMEDLDDDPGEHVVSRRDDQP